MNDKQYRVSVVTVAYGAQSLLRDSINACLNSEKVDVQVILVDNGCTDGIVDEFRKTDKVLVVDPDNNTGFAGGCNLGVEHATGDFIALINPDAVVEPNALFLLCEQSNASHSISTAAVVYKNNPEVVNAAGGQIHILGVSWCRKINTKYDDLNDIEEVLCSSGAALVVGKTLWDELGGLQEEFFTYYEDADFSIRAAQQGHLTRMVKSAVVHHDYDFSRNPDKMYRVDVNRMFVVYGTLEQRTLIALLPAIIIHEIGITIMACILGWPKQRFRALYTWIKKRKFRKSYRASIQQARTVPDSELFQYYAFNAAPPQLPLPKLIAVAQLPITLYIKLIVALLK